jgi:hypothetical protein
VAQLGLHLPVAHAHAGVQADARRDWERVAAVLRAEGVAPPCVLGGDQAIPVAHTLGCTTGGGDDGDRPAALVLREDDAPAGWVELPVTGTYNDGWRVAVPPR